MGEAQNSDEVFLQIEQSIPDVIILDLNMPEKDGLEILEISCEQKTKRFR